MRAEDKGEDKGITQMTTIIMAIVGSTALSQLITFFVQRHDTKKNFGKRMDKLEKDGIRTQLLLLLLFSPEEKKEILTIGQHYFETLQGNWYMTSMFNNWLKTKKIAEPDWFDSKGGE